MLRPTRQNFDEFIHLADKLISENFNQEFFKGDVPLEQMVVRDDGSVEVQRRGTLQLLEEWLKTKYSAQGGKDVSGEVLEPFKKIRKLRQKPAHTLRDNEYDRTYPSQQDDILGDACLSLTKFAFDSMVPSAGERKVHTSRLVGRGQDSVLLIFFTEENALHSPSALRKLTLPGPAGYLNN